MCRGKTRAIRVTVVMPARLSLSPATVTVPTAKKEDQHDDNDDQCRSAHDFYRNTVSVRSELENKKPGESGSYFGRLFAEAREANFVAPPASFFSFAIDFACLSAARMNLRR